LLQVNKQKEVVKKKEETLGRKSIKDKQKKGEKAKKKKVDMFVHFLLYVYSSYLIDFIYCFIGHGLEVHTAPQITNVSFCIGPQRSWLSRLANQQAVCLLLPCMSCYSPLKVEAVDFSETLVNFYQTTQWHTPEGRAPHSHCCESPKPIV
jgi:hypothetical protein